MGTQADGNLGVDGLDFEIDALDISAFLDETRLEEGEVVSRVMAASCTTCECCCSCCCS